MNKHIVCLVFLAILGFSFEVEKINPDIEDKNKDFYMKDGRKVLKPLKNIAMSPVKDKPLPSVKVKVLNSLNGSLSSL